MECDQFMSRAIHARRRYADIKFISQVRRSVDENRRRTTKSKIPRKRQKPILFVHTKTGYQDRGQRM